MEDRSLQPWSCSSHPLRCRGVRRAALQRQNTKPGIAWLFPASLNHQPRSQKLRWPWARVAVDLLGTWSEALFVMCFGLLMNAQSSQTCGGQHTGMDRVREELSKQYRPSGLNSGKCMPKHRWWRISRTPWSREVGIAEFRHKPGWRGKKYDMGRH